MAVVAVVGAGSVGTTLARRLADAGEDVVVGVRDPGRERASRVRAAVAGAGVTEVAAAIARAAAVVVATPGNAVPALAAEYGAALAGRVVLDATNDLGGGHGGPLHHMAEWAASAPDALVCRAFCSVGWEVFADPVVGGERATLPWCGPDAAEPVAERLIRAVGLDPLRVGGPEAADILDGVARLWFQLAFTRGLGRRLAFRVLHDG